MLLPRNRRKRNEKSKKRRPKSKPRRKLLRKNAKRKRKKLVRRKRGREKPWPKSMPNKQRKSLKLTRTLTYLVSQSNKMKKNHSINIHVSHQS